MKKKFLSLMMAAAMVATTSVSAFAQEYSWSDKTDKDVKVNITGDVTGQNGQVIGGTLSVSVPTTTTFTVAQDGTVTAPGINVKNSGTQAVDVYAYKFADETPNNDSEITVVGENDLQSADTTAKLSLKLDGGNGKVYLKSIAGADESGLFTDPDCRTKASSEGVKLASVEVDRTQAITLTGKTRKEATAPSTPVQDKFVLTLKIKKAQS